MSLNSTLFSPCVVIPCYNHGATIAGVVARLVPFGMTCFIIDDGSNTTTQQQLSALATLHAEVRLLRLPKNSGKGAAVLHGLRAAAVAGFSHAVQLDADGQHQTEDVPHMLTAARLHPQRLISGQPIYDNSVPRMRLYGRWITQSWVWAETLSLSLKDSMCGFRVYPILPTLALADHTPLGQRMDFDIEVMVRLYWQGTESYFVPTRVTYPPDGLSHFDTLRDNARLCRMHCRLFFAMLWRIPALLRHHSHRHSHRHAHPHRYPHWSDISERKGLWGMRLMLQHYKRCGRRAFNLLLWPVTGYFWLTGTVARRASQEWLNQVRGYARQQQIILPQSLSSFHHFRRFGGAMLDKIACWRGALRWGRDIDFAPGAQQALTEGKSAGRLILASHLGDIEVCRAMAQQDKNLRINALVFSEHAQRFRQILEEFAPQAGINVIPVSNVGPETAFLLQEKLDAGEWLAIVGDRTPVQRLEGSDRRVVWSPFLGRPAPFPQGPFLLAAALRCPVLLMFALQQQGQLRIWCERFADPLMLPRQHRQQALQQAVDRYAQRLEHYALLSPLDWFNFFDFWQLPELRETSQNKE